MLKIYQCEACKKTIVSKDELKMEGWVELVAGSVDAAKEKVAELFDFDEVIETVAGSIITSHCGKGTLGVLFIYEK